MASLDDELLLIAGKGRSKGGKRARSVSDDDEDWDDDEDYQDSEEEKKPAKKRTASARGKGKQVRSSSSSWGAGGLLLVRTQPPTVRGPDRNPAVPWLPSMYGFGVRVLAKTQQVRNAVVEFALRSQCWWLALLNPALLAWQRGVCCCLHVATLATSHSETCMRGMPCRRQGAHTP